MSKATAGLLFTVLLIACEGPTVGSADRDGRDSLDAELGQDRLNRYDFRQGDFLATGQAMDLAIEGKGFFILRNLDRFVYFRRPAMFSQDAEGYLHLGNTRTRLQGIRLSSDEVPYPALPDTIPSASLSDLEDIRWPFDDQAPPKATDTVKLARNLDSDGAGKGSILHTGKLMHHAEAPDLLTGLYDAEGNSLGIKAGDVLTVSVSANGSAVTTTFAIAAQSTLADLAQAMTTFLRGAGVGAGLGTTVEPVVPPAPDALRGALTLYGNTSPIRNLQITSDRPVGGPQVTRAFALPLEIPAGTARLAVLTETLRSPALPADRLAELFDARGNGLGLDIGDRIGISGSLGDTQARNVPDLIVAADTRLGAVLDRIRETFSLPEHDGTAANHLSVSVNSAGSDDNIADGAVVIRGAPGRASSLRDVSIRASDSDNSKPSPNFFNANMNLTTLRAAADPIIGTDSIQVYDATGKAYRLTLRLIPTQTPGSWLWEAGLEGATLLGGTGGAVRFGADGHVSEWPRRLLAFEPGNGAGRVEIALEVRDLTQFRSLTTFALTSQNGFPAGKLLSVAFAEDGVISGTYANGRTRALYRLPLADFPNRRGLHQVGGNSFVETPESGKPAITVGLDPAGGSIRSGAVEYVSDAERLKICGLFPGC